MPDFGPYKHRAVGTVGVVDDVQAIGTDYERNRARPVAERLHQMRPDLGRLAAEILQIGSSVALQEQSLASLPAQ